MLSTTKCAKNVMKSLTVRTHYGPVHVLCHLYQHSAQTQLVVVIIIFVFDVFVITILFCFLSYRFILKVLISENFLPGNILLTNNTSQEL